MRMPARVLWLKLLSVQRLRPMNKFLIFDLYGIMASWGEVAVGEQRPTHAHPTKSSIVGFLAAALGWCRSDEARHVQLSKALQMAVCVRADGEFMRDYHTVQAPNTPPKGRAYTTRYSEIRESPKNKLNTILSQRDYWAGGVYQIAIGQGSPVSQMGVELEQLAQALNSPHYTLYLGRKACPLSLPVQPQIVEADTLKQAFDLAFKSSHMQKFLGPYFNFFADQNKSKTDQRVVKYYWGEAMNKNKTGLKATLQGPVRDNLHSRKNWQFTNRTEYQATEYQAADPHEADVRPIKTPDSENTANNVTTE